MLGKLTIFSQIWGVVTNHHIMLCDEKSARANYPYMGVTFESIHDYHAKSQRAQLLFGFTQVLGVRNFLTGVNRKTAEDMLAEMGLDISQFLTDKHLTSWAGLAPGNNQSGGKRYSGRTRKSSRTLSAVIVQAAWSAVRTKDTFLKSRYHRLTARRSKKRAIVAVARSILASAWHILTYRQPY